MPPVRATDTHMTNIHMMLIECGDVSAPVEDYTVDDVKARMS